MGTTIHVDGGDRGGCMGCLALFGLLFLFLLCSGSVNGNGKAAKPGWERRQVATQDEGREKRAIDP
jgi:hypothetical protein